MIYKNIEIATDAQGYLKNYKQWSEVIAIEIAKQEGIKMTADHWQVIYFIRDFYLKFNISPSIRLLVKSITQNIGYDRGNSRYLFRLFPEGPAKQASKIAGLPQPVKCL